MKKSLMRSKATSKITVRLTPELADALKQRADRERRTLQVVVAAAIEAYLATKENGR